MTNQEKHQFVNRIIQELGDVSISTVCGILNLPRSDFYYHQNKPDQTEKDKQDFKWRYRIEKVLEEHPCYGYRPMTVALQNRGYVINRKKTLRLMNKFGLSKAVSASSLPILKGKPHRDYLNLLKNIEITRPNQVWASDITFIIIPEGVFYLLAVIDCFTRKVLAWTLSDTYTQKVGIATLKQAMETQELNALKGIIHHSDQGAPYCGEDYIKFVEGSQGRVSMARKGTPTDNPYIESFFKTLKYNEVYLKDYQTSEQARKDIAYFIDVDYNTKRLHSSLGYKPPVDFESEWFQKQQTQEKELVLHLPAKNDLVIAS